jgi:hypothetical protein
MTARQPNQKYENHSRVTSFTAHEVILCCCGIAGHFLESALYDVVVEPGAHHLFEANPFRLLGGRTVLGAGSKTVNVNFQ